MEDMQRYPPHYGLQNIPILDGFKAEEVKGSKEEQNPDEAKIRHSVMKGLWFPILTNLSNLVMEKRKIIKDKAFQVFFRIINTHNEEFTDEFWKEIFS